MENTVHPKLSEFLTAVTGQRSTMAQLNHVGFYTHGLTTEQLQAALDGLLTTADNANVVIYVKPAYYPSAEAEAPIAYEPRTPVPAPDIATAQIMRVFDQLLEDGVDVYGRLATHASPFATRADVHAISEYLLQYLSDLGYTVQAPVSMSVNQSYIEPLDLSGLTVTQTNTNIEAIAAQREAELQAATAAIATQRHAAGREARMMAHADRIMKVADFYTRHKGTIHGIARALVGKRLKK